MGKLPSNIIQHIYEYDLTYKIEFDKVLNQLSAHIFIYRCSECFKEWNNCFVIAKSAEPISDFVIKYITQKIVFMKAN